MAITDKKILIPRKILTPNGRGIYGARFNGITGATAGANQIVYGERWVRAHYPSRAVQGPISFACWGYVDQATIDNDWCAIQITDENSANDYMRFGTSDSSDTPGAAHVRYMWNDNGSITSSFSDAATEIQPRTWFHMAATESGTAQAVYLNGGNKGTDTQNRTALDINGVDSICIGRENDSSSSDTWNGALLWPAVWRAVLTDDEITMLAGGFPPWKIRPESLIFFAPLDGRRNDLIEQTTGYAPNPGGSGQGGAQVPGLPHIGYMPYTGSIPLAGYQDYDDTLISDIPKDVRFTTVPKIVPRIEQPPVSTQLDSTDNPFVRDLTYAYNFASGRTPNPDLVNSVIPSNTDMISGNTQIPKYGSASYMATTGTSGDIWGTNYDPGWANSQPNSGIILIRVSSTESGHIIGQRDGDTTRWQFYHNGSGGLFYRKGTTASSIAGFFVGDNWYLFGWSCSDLSSTSDCRVYKNGLFVSDEGISVNGDAISTDITLGHRWAVKPTTGYAGAFDYALVAIWERKLTDEEHAIIASNPWQIFKPKETLVPIIDPLPKLARFNKPWEPV
jgi:hypothetical protein